MKKINEFLKCKGELIIAGCLPDIAPNRLKEVFNGKIIETRNLGQIDALFDDFKVKFKSIPDAHLLYRPRISLPERFILQFGFNKEFFKKCLRYAVHKLNRCIHLGYLLKNIRQTKRRAFIYLRISYGCIERCAYCTIFRSVGKLKSKTINECVREYGELLKQGYRSFVLLADNLGAYGLDCGSTFAELVQSLPEVDKGLPVKWDIQELHPRWIIKYKDVLSKYVAEGKIISMLCAIQSGSNRILELMNRRHTIEEAAEILDKFKKSQPKLYLWT